MRGFFLLILIQFALFVNYTPQDNASDIIKQSDNFSGIKKFSKFLSESLNTTEFTYNITPLSVQVEHFGSILYSVEVKKTADYFDKLQYKMVKFVAKTTLPSEDFERNCLQHYKESRFYTKVLPALKSFEKSKNIKDTDKIDVFLRYFGTRISLDPNAEIIDSDYVLLLENVKNQNYHNVDDCFDIDDTFVILKELAKMHATFIAMRRLQPALFNSNVRPYLTNAMYKDNADEFFNFNSKEWYTVQNISTKVRTTVGNYLRLSAQYLNKTFTQIETPYTTLCHKDVKTPNFMLKKGESWNVKTKIKIIDFQLIFYDSFVADLIPFFYLSVCRPLLNANFKEFVNYYHSEFLKTIEKYKCPSEDYTLEKIWVEVRKKGKYQLFLLFKRISEKILRNKKLDRDAMHKSIVENWKLLISSMNEFQLL